MRGSYVLAIKAKTELNIQVGALGTINFESGTYAYIGSAQNGIQRRVTHHLKDSSNKHWHIDYLLASKQTSIGQVFAKETKKKREECKLAQAVANLGDRIPNFGCSDCDCDSHLFRIKNESGLKQLLNEEGYSPYQPK